MISELAIVTRSVVTISFVTGLEGNNRHTVMITAQRVPNTLIHTLSSFTDALLRISLIGEGFCQTNIVRGVIDRLNADLLTLYTSLISIASILIVLL